MPTSYCTYLQKLTSSTDEKACCYLCKKPEHSFSTTTVLPPLLFKPFTSFSLFFWEIKVHVFVLDAYVWFTNDFQACRWFSLNLTAVEIFKYISTHKFHGKTWPMDSKNNSNNPPLFFAREGFNMSFMTYCL